jgi:hypothetical protein
MTNEANMISTKTISILLSTIDEDLANNIVMSAISLNSKKILDVIQACIVVSAQRELEAATKEAAGKAEKIVESAMGELLDKMDKQMHSEPTLLQKPLKGFDE